MRLLEPVAFMLLPDFIAKLGWLVFQICGARGYRARRVNTASIGGNLCVVRSSQMLTAMKVVPGINVVPSVTCIAYNVYYVKYRMYPSESGNCGRNTHMVTVTARALKSRKGPRYIARSQQKEAGR